MKGVEMNNLTEKKKNLLNKILQRNNVSFEIHKYGVLVIDQDDKRNIIQVLANEFCEKGLKENDEPNELGLEIEELIDIVNNW